MVDQYIEKLLTEEELEHLKNKNGWAIGDIGKISEDGEVLKEGSEIKTLYQGAYIELLSGDGRATQTFKGIRFMHTVDGTEDTYTEAYGHESLEKARQREDCPCYFVKEYDTDVDIENISPER